MGQRRQPEQRRDSPEEQQKWQPEQREEVPASPTSSEQQCAAGHAVKEAAAQHSTPPTAHASVAEVQPAPTRPVPRADIPFLLFAVLGWLARAWSWPRVP